LGIVPKPKRADYFSLLEVIQILIFPLLLSSNESILPMVDNSSL